MTVWQIVLGGNKCNTSRHAPNIEIYRIFAKWLVSISISPFVSKHAITAISISVPQ